MQSILVPPRAGVKSTRVMTDAEFSAWCAGQLRLENQAHHFRDVTKVVAADNLSPEPTDAHAISEAWWAGFGYGADGEPAEVPAGYSPALADAFRAGHWSGYDNYETELLCNPPTIEDEAEWLGFLLGADGIEAELPTPDDAERAAFERGHDAGDLHLWTVDPGFASYLRERAERAALDDPARDQDRHEIDCIEAHGGAVTTFGGSESGAMTRPDNA